MSFLSSDRRVFSFDIQIADVRKDLVPLTDGYDWSGEGIVVNSYGQAARPTSVLGGTLCTPPMFISDDRRMLQQTLDWAKMQGGKTMWCHRTVVKVNAADLSVDELVKLYVYVWGWGIHLAYMADTPKWFEYTTPWPTYEMMMRVRECTTIDQFKHALTDSGVSGFVRNAINFSSIWKNGTLEFSFFNNTLDSDELFECARFSLSFIDYILNHAEPLGNVINISVPDFEEKFGTFSLPKHIDPLIFSGDQASGKDALVSRVLKVRNPLVGVLMKVVGETLAVTSPNIFALELSLYKITDLTIYNDDEFNHLIYEVATQGYKLEYGGKFAFLQAVNSDNRLDQLVCLMLFYRLSRLDGENDYAYQRLAAHIAKLEENVKKITPVCRELIAMFDKCTYKIGTINDAIYDGRPDIYWQSGNLTRNHTALGAIKKYTRYDLPTLNLRPDYSKVYDNISENQRLMLVSENEFLPLEQIASTDGQIFYATRARTKPIINRESEDVVFMSIPLPPSDLKITDPDKLRIEQVDIPLFSKAQKTYVRKVSTIKPAKFGFLVLYDEYLLGGFGFLFDEGKDSEYDTMLLSDFCTNNNIPRLSKLVLLCLKSALVRRIMSRRMHRSLDSCYTKVYTCNPVSMKYRGLFNRVTENRNGCIIYDTELGTLSDNAAIINQYTKFCERNGKQVEIR